MPARAARMQHSDACNGGMQAYGLRIGEQFCAQAETACLQPEIQPSLSRLGVPVKALLQAGIDRGLLKTEGARRLEPSERVCAG